MKGIRIHVFHAGTAPALTNSVNKWLDEHEDKYVIISISPASYSSGGGYLTIQYTEVKKVLSVPVKSPTRMLRLRT